MEQRPGSIIRIAAPLRGFVQRFTYLGLILAAFGLMLLGKADALLVDRARTHVTDAVTPILDAVSRPVDTLTRSFNDLRNLRDIRAENSRLREENLRLREWQMLARNLAAENKSLQSLVRVVPEPPAKFVTARVIADAGNTFTHALLLNAGKSDGMRVGQAILSHDGFVGWVVAVGLRSARVLLLTDISSRIPVVIETSRVQAILAGNNSDRPKLIHLPPGGRITPGERVVTSGHGGAFPPGLPVGIVAAVTDSGVEVQPFMQRNRLEFVSAVDFGLGGILDTSGLR